MTSRLPSALLATSVHGLALLLLLAAWRAPQQGQERGAAGQRVTTVSISAPRDEASEARPQAKPVPAEEVNPAGAAASAAPRSEPPLVRPILSELRLPKPVVMAVATAPGEGSQEATLAQPAAAQQHAPSQAAAPGSAPSDATPAASNASAPARAQAGSNAYAVKVFRHILRRKAFPSGLAQAGIRGRVLVRFNLTGSGQITDIAVARSSGVAALDGLALEQVRGAVPYPRPPKELSAAQLHFIVPMTYRPST